MDTLRFLGVSPSLDAGREVVGRYRVRETGMLPRFEPGAEAAVFEESAPEPTPWWSRIIGWLRLSAASRPSMPETSASASIRTDELSGDSRCDERSLKPAGIPIDPVPPEGFLLAEKNETKAPRNPIQREFRFENVTVVCNDLHDADFEIVPAPRSRRTSVEATELRVVART